MIDEAFERPVMNLCEGMAADERKQLVQVHSHGVRRRLFGNLLQVAQARLLEGVYALGLPALLLPDRRQATDQDFFCLSAASASRAFAEPATFGVFTAFFDLSDPAFEAEAGHFVAF